jgi:hypothetical protein
VLEHPSEANQQVFKETHMANATVARKPTLVPKQKQAGSRTVTDAEMRQLLSNSNNREIARQLLFTEIPETQLIPDPYDSQNKRIGQHIGRIPLDGLVEFLFSPSMESERHLIFIDREDSRFVCVRREGHDEFLVNVNYPERLAEILEDRLFLNTDSVETMVRKGLEILAGKGRHVVDNSVFAGDPQWKKVDAPDEVTDEIEVQFVGQSQPEGEYIAATPATGDAYPVGAAVIFRVDVEPQEGAVVLAEVVTKPKKPGAEEMRAMLLRRYATDDQTGLVVLRSETKGYPIVKEGVTRTESTSTPSWALPLLTSPVGLRAERSAAKSFAAYRLLLRTRSRQPPRGLGCVRVIMGADE